MASAREWLKALVEGPWLFGLAFLLVLLRFSFPTLIAGLAVSGMDTSGLEAVAVGLEISLPAILFPMVAAILATWPRALQLDARFLVAMGLSLLAAVLWFGELDPGLRVVAGPLASFASGVPVAAAIAAWTIALDPLVAPGRPEATVRTAFRSFGAGFSFAYLLRILHFVDYTVVLGQELPSGVLWVLDYGPILTLSVLAIYFWLDSAVLPRRASLVRLLTPPIVVALLGFGAATGFAGFLLANALAWGGAYTLFDPTLLSESLVGFGVGAFVALAWAYRPAIPRASWRLLVGGVFVAAFAGIQPFGGTLPSLSGITLGLALAARGAVLLLAGTPRQESVRNGFPNR